MDAEGENGSFIQEELTAEQKERIEKNRARALALREQRRQAKPYDRPPKNHRTTLVQAEGSAQLALRDSHAGFIFEDEGDQKHKYQRIEEDVPAYPDEMIECEECKRRFAESYLHSKFQLNVCDRCRDPTGKHSLITKTEAKQRFLLQDRDFGERNGPSLPFLLKKNPHSSQWGEMKLFLLCQVEARAYEIWGGEEGLMEEQQRKAERREKIKEKKYVKEIKALRKAVKSSTSKSTPGKSHVHSFPQNEDTYNPESDTWTKTCSECGFQLTFEKM